MIILFINTFDYGIKHTVNKYKLYLYLSMYYFYLVHKSTAQFMKMALPSASVIVIIKRPGVACHSLTAIHTRRTSPGTGPYLPWPSHSGVPRGVRGVRPAPGDTLRGGVTPWELQLKKQFVFLARTVKKIRFFSRKTGCSLLVTDKRGFQRFLLTGCHPFH